MLDKKAIRKFVNDNPAPAIPPNHGLLRADQIDHIIRTDVRIADHHRTLILYIYARKQAATGNPVPLWTMFHADSGYITLVREPDGAFRWREAAFERLDRDYRFPKKCAFYSAGDEQRVRDYFRDDERGGIAALIHAQQSILDQRARKASSIATVITTPTGNPSGSGAKGRAGSLINIASRRTPAATSIAIIFPRPCPERPGNTALSRLSMSMTTGRCRCTHSCSPISSTPSWNIW